MNKYRAHINYVPVLDGGEIYWQWDCTIYSAAGPEIINLSGVEQYREKDNAVSNAHHCVKIYLHAREELSQEVFEVEI
jgi:hypothetical protein